MTAKAKKKKKTWIIAIVVVVLLAALVFAGPLLLGPRTNLLANVKTVAASTGTIEKTVTGTGNISADETTQDITIETGLKIDQVLVEAGDKISSGDLLATLDAEVLQKAIWTAQKDLNALDLQLSQAKGKTESVYIQTAIAGRIKQIYAVEGESVSETMTRDGALIVLSLDGKMTVTFVPATVEGLAADSEVTVTLSDGTTAVGTIRYVSAELCTVTISDKTAPIDDPVKVASADGKKLLGEGKLAISQPLAITGTDGIVDSILFDLNDSVSGRANLLKLTAAPTSQTYLELYVRRTDKADSLNTLLGYARQNALIADCTGTITKLNLAAGQTTGSSSATTASGSASGSAATAVSTAGNIACVVKTASDSRLSVPIDELDVAVLAVAQEARITLDALPGSSFTGSIVEIAETGIIGQGGTTFQVILDLPEDLALKLGMTATAVITVDIRDNIVKIPLDALQELDEEQFVYVGTAVDSMNLGEKRIVTTGISDGQFVEIRSGLSAGESINYYYASGTSNLFPFGGGMGNPTTTATTK